MEFILSGAFIALILAYAAASLFLTQKVVDLLNVSTKVLKYIVAALSSGVVVFGAKFLGSTAIASVLVALGYVDLPPPEITTDSWFVHIIIWLASFLVSGGIFDWRKKLTDESLL